jgi:hypothetical protein
MRLIILKFFFVFYNDNMATDWTIYVSKAFISGAWESKLTKVGSGRFHSSAVHSHLNSRDLPSGGSLFTPISALNPKPWPPAPPRRPSSSLRWHSSSLSASSPSPSVPASPRPAGPARPLDCSPSPLSSPPSAPCPTPAPAPASPMSTRCGRTSTRSGSRLRGLVRRLRPLLSLQMLPPFCPLCQSSFSSE